ncbi:MAG: aspartate carbamoyltransferase catalytic subunit [Endomicrobium sp.]|jgi:aspartate carbamoyltransferase catalytic subunit|nr:aspartate carbamoyltransferase catalytic subunit [Endomicrobium sp.]
MLLNHKDLLSIEHLSKDDLYTILKITKHFKDTSIKSFKKNDLLYGKTVANLFCEPSTRTKTSFEIAAKKLSADVVNIDVNTSSILKGESLIDTGKTLEAMNINYIVVRHFFSGAPDILAKNLNISIINAGDGSHEHPTQGLLDLYTIYEKKKSFKGLKILLIGDILHSRVAKSNIWALKKMDANVSVVGPPTLIPKNIVDLNVKVYYDLFEAIKDVDVVNVLRIQFERQKENLLPSIEEYIEFYQLTKKKLNTAKSDVLIMHPGPVNRNIEISSDVVDSPSALINEQVTNGIAVRMAVLSLLKQKY